MQRFSVSGDDDLAEWIESQAHKRGVSKAKVIRDAVETAKMTGLVHFDEDETIEGNDLLDRIQDLESRVAVLEEGTVEPPQRDDGETDGLISKFRAHLD